MKTCLQCRNHKVRTEKIFGNLQDDVLDEYNKGTISKSEMINIIRWCEKMKVILIDNYEK